MNGRYADLVRPLIKVVVAGAAIAIALAIAWLLVEVLFLLLAAAILATLLTTLSGFIAQHTPLGHRWSLALAILLFFLVIAAFLYLFGSQLLSEAQQLSRTLPQKVDNLGQAIGVTGLWSKISTIPEVQPRNWLVSHLPGFASHAIDIIGGILVAVAAGVYLAIDPGLYRRGFLLLIPEENRQRVGTAVDTAGQALRLWLLGQLVTMVTVGSAVGIGLYLIGVPSAIALGVIAAVLEFVPFIGPILSAAPSLVLAFSESLQNTIWVLALYIVVQQAENNLIVPLIQRRTVDLPPVLGIFSVVVFGLLFGPLGLFFGTPLAVVILVLVKYLYVRQIEHEDVKVAGLSEALEKNEAKPPSRRTRDKR